MTLLPYAIGDGSPYPLYINDFDATSSLLPLDRGHNTAFPNLDALHTVRTEELVTHRLDDVLTDRRPVDFFKIDTQGAELMVLQGAPAMLGRTAVIHCEVEFNPIYRGQPLYPAIQTFLAAHDFYLVDLLTMARYANKDLRFADTLVWADAIFFRRHVDAATKRVQALIAAAVYHKPSLARHLLDAAAES